MDSDEFDEFDLNEIEAALYAKVHHEMYIEEQTGLEFGEEGALSDALNLPVLAPEFKKNNLGKEHLKEGEALEIDSKYSVSSEKDKKVNEGTGDVVDLSADSDEDIIYIDTKATKEITVLSDTDSEVEWISNEKKLILLKQKASLETIESPKKQGSESKKKVSSVFKKLEDSPLTPGQLKHLNVHHDYEGEGTETFQKKKKKFNSDSEEDKISMRDLARVKANLSFNVTGTDISRSHQESLEKIADIIKQSTASGVEADQTRVPKTWSQAMENYYNCLENVPDYDALWDKLPNNSQIWAVDSVDRYGGRGRGRYFSGLKGRCNNCNQVGHFAKDCPDPIKPIVCSMCGETGHQHFRCKYAMCLQCGGKTREYQEMCSGCRWELKHNCFICKLRGHMSSRCPDVWRRYHVSITPERAEKPEQPAKPLIQRRSSCCNCASPYHPVFACPSKRESILPPHTPHIIYSYSNPADHFNQSKENVITLDDLGQSYDAGSSDSACIHLLIKNRQPKVLRDIVFEEVKAVWPKVSIKSCPSAKTTGKVGITNLHIFGSSESEQLSVQNYAKNAFDFVRALKTLEGKKGVQKNALGHLQKHRAHLMEKPSVCKNMKFWKKILVKLSAKAQLAGGGKNANVKLKRREKTKKLRKEKLIVES